MKSEMLAAMKKELFLRKDELENRTLKSLYFGGGTPSILQASEIDDLINEILKYFSFHKDIEITLEANPDDLNYSYLKDLRLMPINRFSVGIQSFFEKDLELMNRAHTVSEAEKSIKLAQDFGFNNINIDLIYGIPTSNFDLWKRNLDKAIELDIQHISAYALTVEPKTALNQWIKKNPYLSPNESIQNRDFFYMIEFLQDNGFEHYEISNFAKKEYYSKHNSSYWNYESYLGIGASAHSYNGKNIRSWNVSNNVKYIKSLLENNKLPSEKEFLYMEDCYNEMLMIGLRTSRGVNLKKMEELFSKDIMDRFYQSILPKIEDRVLIIEQNYLKIDRKYWFHADGIASDLFLIQ